jgi:hypothetical protein
MIAGVDGADGEWTAGFLRQRLVDRDARGLGQVRRCAGARV